VRGFHRPDALLQPIKQCEVVGIAAEERLTQMDVRLDEAGQQISTARIDHPIRPRVVEIANRRDAALLDEDVARHHVQRVVHRENGGVTDEHGHGIRVEQ